jgi:hypothetical protein
MSCCAKTPDSDEESDAKEKPVPSKVSPILLSTNRCPPVSVRDYVIRVDIFVFRAPATRVLSKVYNIFIKAPEDEIIHICSIWICMVDCVHIVYPMGVRISKCTRLNWRAQLCWAPAAGGQNGPNEAPQRT